jgi:CrcB protein
VSLGAARVLGAAFPYGTLFVNVVGSFLIGLIMHVGLHSQAISLNTRLLLTTGVMGGLTTYSTFNYETLGYVQQGAWRTAAVNLLVTVVGCLGAGVAGLASGRALVGT